MSKYIKNLQPKERARYLASCDRFKAEKQKPPTRTQAKAWLAPIRKSFVEMLSGEVDAHRGYAITRIHYADNDFARIDHAINGFVALIERLMPDFDISAIRKISKKLEAGILLEASEVHDALALLKRCEDRLIKFRRFELVDAANVEMVAIELERLGLKDAA
ncbi:MAG: hypothetical protein WBK19_10330 [Azonexus sp.]